MNDLAYRCRECKKELVGRDNVRLQELNFHLGDGKARVVTVIWCKRHEPKGETNATLQG